MRWVRQVRRALLRAGSPHLFGLTEFRMSTSQTNASAGGFLRWTRFVLVNDRVPRANAGCALCCRKIEKGYVRESQTRLLYCDMQCFAGHPIAIETRERKVA
jgi:hypothetical protein